MRRRRRRVVDNCAPEGLFSLAVAASRRKTAGRQPPADAAMKQVLLRQKVRRLRLPEGADGEERVLGQLVFGDAGRVERVFVRGRLIHTA